MKFDNQLRYALQVIERYDGIGPLHVWLKNYFREHKQMGSRDRRQLGNLVYSYYRLGHAVKGMPPEDRLLLGLYCCQGQGELLSYFRPDWPDGNLEERIAFAGRKEIGLVVEEIFPWWKSLSDGIIHRDLCVSFLRQPDLFLRIRPGHEAAVKSKAVEIGARIESTGTLRLPNGSKTEDWFETDVSVVVQDYSSQKIADFLPSAAPKHCWDACAASGGKSILVHDRYPGVSLTVSDIRPSILHNLEMRFEKAGIKSYQSFVADLTQPAVLKTVKGRIFDLVLADVPCSGSGTWGRTPEDLYFFTERRIGEYSQRQQAIMRNIVPLLKKGANLLYITCSVFREENEEMTAMLRRMISLEPGRAGTIPGYAEAADSMYAARFTI